MVQSNKPRSGATVGVVVLWGIIVSSCLLVPCAATTKRGIITEQERQAEFIKRGYSWPIVEYVPNTPGWKKLNEHRFRQVAEIDDRDQRFEGYLQTIQSGLMAPNFTQYGFGLARAPDDLMEDLRFAIRNGLANNEQTDEDGLFGIKPTPWFIDRPDLTQRVLEELHHYIEAWSGVELIPNNAYGFRLYRNSSTLKMHIDKPQTHVLSFILHVDSSDDAQPWPILIEDFNGRTHEVTLTSGDMLFYESSKCFHGRPIPFNGSWYTSVFVHYYPKGDWIQHDHMLERQYALPSQWSDPPNPHQKLETPLLMESTTVSEPTCPNHWCATEHTVKWSGPGEKGYWIDPTFQKIPFHPVKRETISPAAYGGGDENCPNDHASCADWAAVGECDKNPNYMLLHCKKSCGLC